MVSIAASYLGGSGFNSQLRGRLFIMKFYAVLLKGVSEYCHIYIDCFILNFYLISIQDHLSILIDVI